MGAVGGETYGQRDVLVEERIDSGMCWWLGEQCLSFSSLLHLFSFTKIFISPYNGSNEQQRNLTELVKKYCLRFCTRKGNIAALLILAQRAIKSPAELFLETFNMCNLQVVSSEQFLSHSFPSTILVYLPIVTHLSPFPKSAGCKFCKLSCRLPLTILTFVDSTSMLGLLRVSTFI